ncbi:hypothetical protein B7494_g3157 [Chlorociboria aeruginascens]|nr:hypothetical protein B7494_g3157 [Chlorociboria aeruginascens]
MSSSEQAVSYQTSPDLSDQVMMEAPDSPPEVSPHAGPAAVSPTQQHPSSRNGEPRINHGPPGSSWNTKKFQDEYDRVYNGLQDQNWDHTRYGDPLLKSSVPAYESSSLITQPCEPSQETTSETCVGPSLQLFVTGYHALTLLVDMPAFRTRAALVRVHLPPLSPNLNRYPKRFYVSKSIMASAVGQDRFANGPFKLIETPVHSQKSVAPHDQYVEGASIMALGHNVIIRGLNSIYRQAPNITANEASHFISYAKCWVEVLDAHHNMEEDTLFPMIETKCGEQDAFLPGIKAFREYLDSISSTPEEFSGNHLTQLIDDFAPVLTEHLSDEIPTLLALSRFGDKLPLRDMINFESKKSPLFVSKTGGTPFFFRNLDLTFEDGLWANWPPMPKFVWWFMNKTFVRVNQNWWKYASCDDQGQPQELPALGK